MWAVCLVLAINHLLFLATYDLKPGFWLFTFFLLVCYSLPFLLLMNVRIPETLWPQKCLFMTFLALVFAMSLFIPLHRFLPGYRSEPLESLAYIAIPVVQVGLIVLFLLGRGIVARLRYAKPKA
jgi:hypothetical protein